jgi:pyruvate formate lyase activating enzyme
VSLYYQLAQAMNTSLIFDIKRYAINDGPGIRLTVFFKGCPLSCKWCHNPESISPYVQKLYTASKCIGSQKCVEICPNDALVLTENGIVTDIEACQLCGKCAEICPTKAIEMSGSLMTVKEIMKIIEKETLFFDQSGGGVTFSGGEPLMHPHLLLKLLKECGRKGIHRVVDTTLFARQSLVLEVAQNTDLFLIDLKHMNSFEHKKFTGVPNELILENILELAKTNTEIIFRMPLIKGVNADIKNIENTVEFIKNLPGPMKSLQLLPYHNVAIGKHTKMGNIVKLDGMETPSKGEIEKVIAVFKCYGIQASPM